MCVVSGRQCLQTTGCPEFGGFLTEVVVDCLDSCSNRRRLFSTDSLYAESIFVLDRRPYDLLIAGGVTGARGVLRRGRFSYHRILSGGMLSGQAGSVVCCDI